MATTENRRIVMASRPEGEPKASDFRLESGPAPRPGAGEVLLKTRWLSLDPYMRGRMSTAKSYAKSLEVGDTMDGGTVAEIVASENPAFVPGDIVLSHSGWQDYALADGKGLRKLDPGAAPIQTALGLLGMPGMTAYSGLKEIGKPKAGETVAVAAATGPVGSLVGQLAKLAGARAVAIAGGAEKCRAATEEFGFDAAIDHRAADFAERLAAACPKGIDVYWENVGGEVFQAVLPFLNDFARVPVCGLIAQYNATELPSGPDRTPQLMRQVLSKRLHIQGFIVWDFGQHHADFLREVGGWLREGKIKYREDVVEGLEKAPDAFIGLLKGRNFGKLLVKVA